MNLGFCSSRRSLIAVQACFSHMHVNICSLVVGRELHVELFHLSGEFTLRAFLNGRLDLSQAENVGNLISAKSVAAADAALAGIQVCCLFRIQYLLLFPYF